MALAKLTPDEKDRQDTVMVKCVSLPKHMVERIGHKGEKIPGLGYNARNMTGVKPGDTVRLTRAEADKLVGRYPKGGASAIKFEIVK